jgi:two-component system response regulator HydG
LLVHHFLVKHSAEGAESVSVDDDALEELASRHWPGNVRELENTIESALALSSGPRLTRAGLEPVVGGASRQERAVASESSSIPLSLDAYERCALERALREENGDATAAARRLGIGRSTFYRKLSKQGIRVQPRELSTASGVSASGAIR